MKRMTREEWLLKLTKRLAPKIERQGYPVRMNKIRVSCGLPSSRGLHKTKRVIGQCWPKEASERGVNEIFISPTIADSIEVAHTLLHELIHAAVGCEHGHRGPFGTVATGCGLAGPLTATVPSASLKTELRDLIREVGKYPHSPIDKSTLKKQTTRLIKAICEDCGYTIRISRKWIWEAGLPNCPTCRVCLVTDP